MLLLLNLLSRDTMLTWYMQWSTSVCPAMCLSYADIVSKWLHSTADIFKMPQSILTIVGTLQ